MKKRSEGRHEAILEPELPIIDAHHHLLHRGGVRYLMEELLQDVQAGHDIRATVFVERHSMFRTDGPEMLRPVGETDFAKAVATLSASGSYGTCRLNAAIIPFANLATGDKVAETLDAHAAAGGANFRGVRQVTIWHPSEEPYRFIATRPAKDIMNSSGFRAGFARLADHELSFDAAVFHTQLDDVADLADAFPRTTIVLNHMGFAMGLGLDHAGREEVRLQWLGKLRTLAERQNVVVKVGGLGMPFWGFGFEERCDAIASDELAATWRPYVEPVIELFGTERCMLESNFPADGNSCGYVPLWNALKKLCAHYSSEERTNLFYETARRIYRLDLPDYSDERQ